LKDPAPLGEIAGRLVMSMQKLDELFAAAQILASVRSQYPDVPLLDHGTAIDSASLSAELVRKLAALQRPARIGPEIKSEARATAGWSIMPARSRRAGRSPEHVMMIAYSQAQVGLWGVAGPEGAGRMQLLWTRNFNGQPPVLLRTDPESVYLYWDRTDAGDG